VDDLPGELNAAQRRAWPRCLALDAMGVIFSADDDVAELLIPFVREAGGTSDARAIEAAYLEASVGNLDADAFWAEVGLSPDVEPDYLRRHSVRPGALAFMARARRSGLPIWCLSNDLGRWSKRLRVALGVEPLLAGAVISGDVKVRKPERAIYERLLVETGYSPADLLFVDDRVKNVAAAAALGIRAVQFTVDYGYAQLAADLFDSDARNWRPAGVD
jgi:FMN phosphatase YigB (HAD superfamily)